MSHSIKDTDHGFRALRERLAEGTGSLTVGVHEADGAEMHEQKAADVTYDKADRAHLGGKFLSKAKAAALSAKAEKGAAGKKSQAPLTVLQVAAFHEFGTSRTPRRSFIADWADENEGAHKEQLRKMAAAVVKGTVKSMEQGLERLGNLYVGEVQRRIAAGIDPPLAGSTVERKGSSKPLIDTGQLRSSIRFKLNDEGSD